MRIAVTGSIATDHLMTFPGRFADSFVEGSLDKVSLSFLVDELEIRRGGVAANIAFGLGVLGLRPVLVGAVGPDFADYRSWLDRHGVDTESVHVSAVRHSARFICTTDVDQCQIASFYPGAMGEARDIELGPVVDRVGGLDLVLVGANDPAAMERHTAECRYRGIPFMADPSQQLARLDGPGIEKLIEGARYLISNEYESKLILAKTGLKEDEILGMVGTWITTLGAAGSRIRSADGTAIDVACPREEARVDPTGVGDAFRAGYLAGLAWSLKPERCAQIGSLLATYVIETIGTQEYDVARAHMLRRLEATYGAEAATDVRSHLVP